VGDSAIFVPDGIQTCFIRAFVSTLERDRHGQRIVCRYDSPAWGPIGDNE
jgi:hypothetical protein